jgi:hypothetical protein
MSYMKFNEAMESMSKGNVIAFVDHEGNQKTRFRMHRCIVFKETDKGLVQTQLIYDPHYNYVNTGDTVDKREWPGNKYSDNVQLYTIQQIYDVLEHAAEKRNPCCCQHPDSVRRFVE